MTDSELSWIVGKENRKVLFERKIAMESAFVTIRLYEELNDFVPRKWSHQAISLAYRGRRTIKDLLESIGVPHVEIGRIQVGECSVGFEYIIQESDDIHVYPGIRIVDPLRFIVDANVAKLCPLLRMLGFDTLYVQGATDSSIASISEQDQRSVLTRDRGLLKRKAVSSGLYLRSIRPLLQVQEVVDRFNLRGSCKPFSRCLICNHALLPLSTEEALTTWQVPPEVRKWSSEFFHCVGCQKVFWKGSHHESMEKVVRQILAPP